jgi:hypothetical protein
MKVPRGFNRYNSTNAVVLRSVSEHKMELLSMTQNAKREYFLIVKYLGLLE